MKDLDSALAIALRESADTTAATVDTAAGLSELVARMDRCDTRRRRTRWIGAATIAAAAAAAVVVVLAGRPFPHASPAVPTHRSPTSAPSNSPSVVGPTLDQVTMADRPLLTSDDLARLVGVRAWHPASPTRPAWEATCAGPPTTWRAAHVDGARYRGPNPNSGDDTEWLLRYPDAGSARRAVTKAIQNCTEYTELTPTSGFPAASIKEPNGTGRYESVFVVGRDGNVVVVLSTQSFGSSTTRALAYALQRAIPSEARRCVRAAAADPSLRPLCLLASQTTMSAPRLQLRADPLWTDFGQYPAASGGTKPVTLTRLPSGPSILSSCIGDPTRLGAAQTWGAAYGNPRTPVKYTEHVLAFADASGAHAALLQLWRDSVRCPANGGDDLGLPGGDWTAASQQGSAQIDEDFAGQWGASTRYAIRVGRSNNVLFVIQDLVDPDDRAMHVLSVALAQALAPSPP